jgi:voltage-gated potassium channel
MTRQGIIAALDGSHPTLGSRVALVIYALIIVSAVVIALETLPGLTPETHRLLIVAEFTILTVFAIEYILRLACSPKPLSYAFSFWGIIDFIAIVPAVLFLFPDLTTVRAMRLLRLLRILKLLKANRALERIAQAFVQIRAELLIFLFVGTVLLYLAAVGIYHFEHIAQPEAFGSIPASLWWALATLTTVGYGDVVPITTGGRAFTGLVLMVGIGIVAVPAGLITASLLNNRTGGATPPAFDGNLPKTQETSNTEDMTQ